MSALNNVKERPSFAETVGTGSVTSTSVNKHGGAHRLTDVNINHAIEIDPVDGISAFEYSKAVAEVVTNQAIKYVGRRSGKVIVYLKDVSFVTNVTNQGINVGETHYNVTPVIAPIRKVVISNVNPEIPDQVIISHIKEYGEIAKPLIRMSAGFPSPFQHVLSFRSQCGMILKDEVRDDSHVIFYGSRFHHNFISTDGVVCFRCRKRGHIRKDCKDVLDQDGR